MNGYKIKYLLLCSSMLLLIACGKSDWEEDASLAEGTTSLTLTFKPAETKLSTRGVEDLNDDGAVSDDELYVDGRRMYRLGVFLADSEGNIVESTVLEEEDTRFNDDNTAATVLFNDLEYDKTYTLYAVANYGGFGDLTGYIRSITKSNVTGSHSIQATSDNLCNRSLVYPLSLKEEISIERGKNTFSGSLKRTYARLRVGVNNSIDEKLRVTGLSFPNEIVSSETDLFTEGGTANAIPNVTSASAITPFQSNMVVPKADASGDAMGTTIFDAYLLESNGGTYQYTLGLKLGDDANYKIKGNKDQIRDRNNVNGNGKGPYYVICNTLSNLYLYADPDTKKVKLGNSYGTDGAIDPYYVWELERTTNENTNYNFLIESMGLRAHYMQASQATNNQALTLSTNPDYALVDTHADDLIFKRGNYILAVDNNEVYWSSGELTGPHTIQQFLLYEVEPLNQGTSGSITYNQTIPINIDAIKRNDFINIVVNVSYSRGSRQVSSTCVIE